MLWSVIVPCYKENQVLAESVYALCRVFAQHGVEQQDMEVLLVVEKSEYGTIDVARSLEAELPHVRVLENDRCYGKGYTVRRGVLETRGEYVLVVDADLPVNLEKYFPLMNVLLAQNNVGAVYATALRDKTNHRKRGAFRAEVTFALYLLRRWGLGQTITDSQFGCKLYKGDAVRTCIEIVEESGFLYEIMLTDLLLLKGFEIEECSVSIDSFAEVSSVNVWSVLKSIVLFGHYTLVGRKKLMRKAITQKSPHALERFGRTALVLTLFFSVLYGGRAVLAANNQNYQLKVLNDTKRIQQKISSNTVNTYGCAATNPNSHCTNSGK